MSVAEILHQIEALPSEERLQVLEHLLKQEEAQENWSEEDQQKLEAHLRKQPELGKELGAIADRMRAGSGIDLDELKFLHKGLSKLGL